MIFCHCEAEGRGNLTRMCASFPSIPHLLTNKQKYAIIHTVVLTPKRAYKSPIMEAFR